MACRERVGGFDVPCEAGKLGNQEEDHVRRLISFMVVTSDCYHEGPNGEFDWPIVDDEFKEFAINQPNDIDTCCSDG